MKNTIKVAGLLFFLSTSITYAQSESDKAKAFEKGNQAVKLEDEGKYEEALKLLDEAQKLDPTNYNYPYEVGYTYYAQQEYKKALKEFKKVVKYNNITDQCFQMLGNTYDVLGDSANAFKAYDEGLKMFPNSGALYLEKGNVYWAKKQYTNALPFYEQGIQVAPRFPSNYYRAARLYLSSDEEVWGMIYGEIFMNLETGTKRTAEISKLLYDTYKSEIKFTSDSSFSVSFSKSATITIDDVKDPKNIKLPFGIGVYEPTLMLSVINEKTIDINSLDRIRKNFVEFYYQKGNDKKYPNILFEFQNEAIKAGNFEAYNHWILMKGDEDGFTKWQSANKDKWESFVKWFKETDFPIDDTHKFSRYQY
jgi:tetratricopeptide (TPR) repeat protein